MIEYDMPSYMFSLQEALFAQWNGKHRKSRNINNARAHSSVIVVAKILELHFKMVTNSLKNKMFYVDKTSLASPLKNCLNFAMNKHIDQFLV